MLKLEITAAAAEELPVAFPEAPEVPEVPVLFPEVPSLTQTGAIVGLAPPGFDADT